MFMDNQLNPGSFAVCFGAIVIRPVLETLGKFRRFQVLI